MTDEEAHDSRQSKGERFRAEMTNLLTLLEEAARIHRKMEPKGKGEQWLTHRHRDLLFADTKGLVEGMRDGRISISQTRVQQNVRDIYESSSGLASSVQELDAMMAALRLFVREAAKIGITAENQQVGVHRSPGIPRP